MNTGIEIFSFLLLMVAVTSALLIPKLSPRVTGGEDASPGQFPFMVSIEKKPNPFDHHCGGSILNENFVLTAAHCVEIATMEFRVKAGKHFRWKDDEHVQSVDVERRFIHENYGTPPGQHDIAVLKLKSPLKFNARVQPIQLPVLDNIPFGEMIVSGWGSVSNTTEHVEPNVLRYARVPIIDYDTCRSIVSELGFTDLCSNDLNGGISACGGDSGSPLVQYQGGSIPVQLGIVSRGYSPCSVAGKPAINTRVSAYIDWINKQMIDQ